MARLTRLVPKHLLLTTGTLVAAGVIAAFTFQNCAKVQFESAPDSLSSLGDPVSKTPQYVNLKAGDESFLPPLKLIFVVDNSGTMQANQINLGRAFSKLFEGSNGKNLAPFDSTAYVINTAQRSILKSADAKTYSRLPSSGVEDLSRLSAKELASGPRATLLDGSVPGDLVGYRVLETQAGGLSSTTYLPAPVALFKQEAGRNVSSLVSHKSKDGSLAEFSQDFRDRIALLDPSRSAIDPATNTGVLDSVIDNESGLCALARVMRHKDQFVKPGELSAFFIVSDEDDADPVGKNCIDSVSDERSTENFVDAKCITPKTTIKYRERNPNPAVGNCAISYDTGFKYKYEYSVPQSELKYFRLQRDYKVRQTEISYTRATNHTFKQPQLVFSYFTKAPTYKIPQSTITYFRKVESCESYRDGNKFNCTYSYPKATTSPIAQSFTDCRAFAQGRLPADALLNDSSYPLTCQQLEPIAKSGACSAGDTNVIECKQNYSASRKSSSVIDGSAPQTEAACISLAQGKIEAGAVLNDPNYEVKCVNAGTRDQAGTGPCPNNGFTCSQVTATAKTTLDGVMGSGNCVDYAKANQNKLSSYAILDGSASVTCSEIPGRQVKNENGLCSSLPSTTTTACIQHPAATESKTVTGEKPSGKTCLQFVKDTLGSGTAIDESAAVNCAVLPPVTRTSAEKTIAFTHSATSQFDPILNVDCLSSLKNLIQTNDRQTATKCSVTSLISADFSYNEGKVCEQLADTSQKCSTSNRALRNCRSPRSTLPGDEYKSNLTEIAGIQGTFTCESACRDTNLCPAKSGTVADNYKDCESKAADSERLLTRVAQSRAICQNDENPTAVLVKSYPPEIGTHVEYVAGSKTESNEANALASYIRDQAGSSVQSVSVFVRQPSDGTGSNGSIGRSYNTFADLMGGGEKKSVLGSADAYASTLESLGAVISQKLRRSFAVGLRGDQSIKRVWFRKSGTQNWGEPLAETDYQVTGGTVTIASSFNFDYQDEFRFEFY